uniref:Uncharacterized protein n=1 Tax=Rhizophora mucronata TaxID=61149 RepID=A0A2P2LF27_RHIMU
MLPSLAVIINICIYVYCLVAWEVATISYMPQSMLKKHQLLRDNSTSVFEGDNALVLINHWRKNSNACISKHVSKSEGVIYE